MPRPAHQERLVSEEATMRNCSDNTKFLLVLYESFGSNTSGWTNALSGGEGCEPDIITGEQDYIEALDHGDLRMGNIGQDIYGYITPFIAIIGLLDNILSLCVFLSKFMRRLSSTCYLATLSACHILVLLTYVLLDWLHKGLVRWPGKVIINLLTYPVSCHIFLYVSYTFRFAAIWLIVAFTVERYIVICYPKYRRAVCSRSFAKKVTLGTLVCAGLFSAYKPALSGVYEAQTSTESLENGANLICAANPNFRHLNFLMDSIYVLLITALPSFVISALSIPIFRKLCPRETVGGAPRLVFKERRIRLELTVILLAIAWCFILLTLPYFITWCLQFFQSLHHTLHSNQETPFQMEVFSGKVAITRTLYYLNYASNFFLYCLTGAHYRRQVRSILLKSSSGSRNSARSTRITIKSPQIMVTPLE